MGRTIGIYGLGAVGLAVARRLVSTAVAPYGWRRGAKDDFVAMGGIACDSLSDLLGRCDLLLVCTPSSALRPLVDALLSAPEARTKWLVDLGVAPIEPKRLAAAALARHGVQLLDAPIQGNPPLIEQGKAVVYVSGDQDAGAQVAPTLLRFAAAAPYVGVFGNGSRLKFAANLLMAIHTAAAAEAVAYCRRVGLDASLLLDVCPPIVQSGVLNLRGRTMVERTYRASSGSISGLLESIEIIVQDAGAAQLHLPMLRSVAALLEQAKARGLGNIDSPGLVEVYDRDP